MSLLVPGDRVSVVHDDHGRYLEHLWECPCGSWQLHVSPAALVMADSRPPGMHRDDVDDALSDAMWEHEAECEVLQHAALQAGIPRPMDLDPFTREPRSTAVNSDEERTPDLTDPTGLGLIGEPRPARRRRK
jgi:hypothetical protein